MATRLEVVNQCLAVMGEAPLNSIVEDHAFKPTALSELDRLDRTIQAEGWWFNTEDLALVPSPVDGRIYLPTDALTFFSKYDRPRIVQRGRFLYNTEEGTNLFVEGTRFECRLIRRVAFEDLPVSVNEYIARATVLHFQNNIDGDSTKTRDLKAEIYGDPQRGTIGLKGEAKKEHIRNVRFNFIDNSERLSRITNVVNYSRRPR